MKADIVTGTITNRAITVDILDLKDWLTTSKAAVDLWKAALSMLPKSKQKDDIEAKVREASNMLARSDALLAKELNYHLCECTFPPQIMLWRETTQSWDCPGCTHKISKDEYRVRSASRI